MKMTQEHFDGLAQMIGKFQREDLEAAKVSYKAQGLTGKRYRWDVLWSIPRADRQAWFDTGVYDYLNDDHIDTALRSILKTDW